MFSFSSSVLCFLAPFVTSSTQKGGHGANLEGNHGDPPCPSRCQVRAAGGVLISVNYEAACPSKLLFSFLP